MDSKRRLSGERMRLACWFRRLAETNFSVQRKALLVLIGLVSLALAWPGKKAAATLDFDIFFCCAALQGLLCLAGAALVWRARFSRATFWIVLGVAAFLRLPLPFETPRISDDLYRYIWDGRVQASGINPYRYIPADPALAGLRDEKIYPHINRRDYARTIYPPVAQMMFFTVTRVSESMTWFKTALLGFELVTIWSLARLLIIFGLPRERILVYAWNPLVFWEFSGSGHIDAAMIAFIALALLARHRGREVLTGVLLACAVLFKFFPLVLFPALYRRGSWKMPAALFATLCFAYGIYLGVGAHVFGFLPAYTVEEGMGRGRFFLLLLVRYLVGGVPTFLYFAFAFVSLSVLAAFALFRWSRNPRAIVLAAGALAFAFTFFLSPQFPWYWTWTVAFLVFLPWSFMLPFFYVTAVSLVQYGTWFNDWPMPGMSPHLALGLIQFLPFAVWLGAIGIMNRKPTTSLPTPAQGWGAFASAALALQHPARREQR